jgi:hypothetical protein
LNNPVRYADPTGHSPIDGPCGYQGQDCGGSLPTPPPTSPPNIPNGGGDGCTNSLCLPQPPNDPPSNGGGTLTSAPASNLEAFATILDTGAMGFNGVYALTGDLVGVVCPSCYPYVIGGYQYYSYIPNSISTVSMILWIMEGVDSGENSLTINQTSQGTTVSLTVSQDTIAAVGTNIAGWTLLKEPNAAFAVDALVAGYDYGRLGAIPLSDFTIPTWVNPTVTYNSNTGLEFSWQPK